MGIEVYDSLPGPAEPLAEHLRHGGNAGVSKTAAWISVPTHAQGWWKGQRPVIFTMWEAMTLPPSFRETLHEFDLVIVPSKQNVELFSQYHGNVQYCPLGIDPVVWHYRERRPPGAFFDFLISGSGPRKGVDLAHRAFRKLWGTHGSWPKDGPAPRLIMKNIRGEDYYGDRVELVTGRISPEAEVALYESAHCYVQPSRGEGFGLQPLQAIAQGLPTILTNAHGHEAFAGLGLPVSASPAKAAYFIYGDAGEWWEPNFDELCDQMKYVYENWEKCADQAYHSAMNVVAQKFTWKDTAHRFIDLVGGGNLGDLNVKGAAWHKPELQRFRVITNRDWHCDIAGASYQFRKGQEYWEVADIKRILFEGGVLDPACLGIIGPNGETDMDMGLLPGQVERIPEYSARHSRCMTCGQRLNQEQEEEPSLLLTT